MIYHIIILCARRWTLSYLTYLQKVRKFVRCVCVISSYTQNIVLAHIIIIGYFIVYEKYFDIANVFGLIEYFPCVITTGVRRRVNNVIVYSVCLTNSNKSISWYWVILIRYHYAHIEGRPTEKGDKQRTDVKLR